MVKRLMFYRMLGVLLLFSGAFQVATASGAAPLQKIVFVFAGFNERSGYIFVAKDRHLFEEQGLDAQIVQVRNGQVAVSALAASRTCVAMRWCRR